MSDMRSEDLRALVCVVELGSLSAAAKRLELPKSTLGRRLSRLEEQLDTQLLVRSPRKTQVTAAGRRLYERAEPLLAELDELRLEIMDRPSEPTGELRVAAPGDLSTAMVGSLCAAYTRRHAKVRVHLLASNYTVDLLSEGFDVALRVHMRPLPSSSDLKLRRLGPVSIALYASPTYLEAKGRPRTPSQLGKHALLTMAAYEARWPLVRVHDGRRAPLEHRARLVSDDHHALRDAAVADAGIAVLPSFVAAEAEARGSLVRVLPRWSLPSVDLSLLWPARRHLAPRVRAFIDLAVETLGA